MPAANYLPEVLETTEAERLATGFIFTEGPLWHPEGYWYFVDIRQNKLFRLSPGKEPEVVRNTIGGNGTPCDLQARLIVCECGRGDWADRAPRDGHGAGRGRRSTTTPARVPHDNSTKCLARAEFFRTLLGLIRRIKERMQLNVGNRLGCRCS